MRIVPIRITPVRTTSARIAAPVGITVRTAVLLAAWAVAAATATAQEGPLVVTSIRPVHSLAAGVMGATGSPELIVSGYGSPHFYQMRPSQARALARADVVFWIGESFETFMAGPIGNLSGQARVVALIEAEGLELHPVRTGNLWEDRYAHAVGPGAADPTTADPGAADSGAVAPDTANPGAADPGAADSGAVAPDTADPGAADPGAADPGAADRGPADSRAADPGAADSGAVAPDMADPHIWLAPANAKTMVDAIVRALAGADPDRSVTYSANGAALKSRIDELDARIRARLAGVTDVPFVLFHDSLRYFESAFDLRTVGAVMLGPERQPGGGTLRALRRHMAAAGVACIVVEPQFTPALVETLAAGTAVEPVVIDPLGGETPLPADSYFRMMDANADTLAECLQRG